MVENIAPEDAQVCGSRVDERGKLAADVSGTAVITGQFEHGPDQHKTTRPADSLKAQARRCRGRRKSEARQEVRTEDRAISAGIDEKRLGLVGPVASMDLGPQGGASHAIVTNPPLSNDKHRCAAPFQGRRTG